MTIPIRYIIPVKTVSEANTREHWAVKADRAKRQRLAAHLCTLAALCRAGWKYGGERVIIRLCRKSTKQLDGDNLQSSQKHVRDGIADALEVDDGDKRLSWRYRQSKCGGNMGPRTLRECGVTVRIDVLGAKEET